jgi:hypothetical protein
MNERKIAVSGLMVASAALLAGLLMAACGNAEEKPLIAQKPPAKSAERWAKITIEVDAAKNPIRILGVATDDPDSQNKDVALSKSKRSGAPEHVCWTVEPLDMNGKIAISLKPNSPDPFKGGNWNHSPKRVVSPHVSPDVEEGPKYSYSITLYNKDGIKVDFMDPTIRVDP